MMEFEGYYGLRDCYVDCDLLYGVRNLL